VGEPRAEAARARLRAALAAVDGYGFDACMGFLVGRILVIRQNGDFAITVKGRTYLMWRVHNGRGRRLG
jgi:hypothetical protein